MRVHARVVDVVVLCLAFVFVEDDCFSVLSAGVCVCVCVCLCLCLHVCMNPASPGREMNVYIMFMFEDE